jgi:hypothetical protein
VRGTGDADLAQRWRWLDGPRRHKGLAGQCGRLRPCRCQQGVNDGVAEEAPLGVERPNSRLKLLLFG